eukprot:4747597-Pyramimonas_sp.AAC.1
MLDRLGCLLGQTPAVSGHIWRPSWAAFGQLDGTILGCREILDASRIPPAHPETICPGKLKKSWKWGTNGRGSRSVQRMRRKRRPDG